MKRKRQKISLGWLALLVLLSAHTALGAPAHVIQAKKADLEQLQRGFELYRQGDYQRASEALRPLAQAKLASRDYALYLLAESESLNGASSSALKHFHLLAALQQNSSRKTPNASTPGSRFALLAQARIADLSYDLNKLEDAARIYRQLMSSDAPEIERAVVLFQLGEIAQRQGNPRAAQEYYRLVLVKYPEHPLAERALSRLKTFDASVEITPDERLQRASHLIDIRQWERALTELAQISPRLTSALRDQADYWIGTAHFRMRRGYDIAAAKLQGVAERLKGEQREEALFHGARAWSRAEQDDRAIAGYRDLVARFPRSRFAPEASFLIGWLEYNRGHYREALPSLAETLKHYGASSFGDDALWYQGFTRWLLGDTAGALGDFTLLAKRGGALDGGKGRYWQGRALGKLGRNAEAKAAWRSLVAEYPLSHYALLGRVRLAELNDPVGSWDGAKQTEKARAPGEIDKRLAALPEIIRSDELMRAGMQVEASYELERAQPFLLKRYGPRILPLLFDRYLRADNFFRVHRLAENYAGDALRHDPHSDVNARAWWQLVYPLAYRAFIEQFGPSGKNPKYYLYTIMQKESAYNPHDVSYADAIGLLQMIPPTSRRVGERIGRPYTDDVLYDPAGNIQFGAWYIGHLLEKFGGQIAIGAGSYNAGPKAMMRWLKLHGAHPLDEFIELCPYTQTREYMKKVLGIYAHYLYLYDHEDWLPSMTVDPKYQENEIIY